MQSGIVKESKVLKKKKGKASNRAVPSTNENGSEDGSEMSPMNETTETDIQSVISEQISALTEKRSSTRGHALDYIAKLLRHFSKNGVAILKSRWETLMYNVGAIIRKPGNSTEAVSALKVLSLSGLTLRGPDGINANELFLSYAPHLQKTIANDGKSPEEREAAVEALAVLAWVNLQTDELEASDVRKVFAIFDSAWDTPEYPPMVVRAAGTAIWLMLSCMPQSRLAGSFFTKYIKTCAFLLSHPVPEVRNAAGEIIALLQEASLACESPDEPVDFDAVDMDAVIENISNLATDATRQQSKKDRAKQKSFFREILKTVEDGELPVEKMEIRKVHHEFEGWRLILPLDFMRSLLGAGLPDHLVNNELLSDLFMIEIPEDDEEKTSPENSRHKKATNMARQGTAKEQYHSIAKERKKKNAFRDEADMD